MTYAQAANERALPSFIDGCKDVNRRILYTMAQSKLFPDKKSIKSATIVGRTLALHPHGDSSVYGALVRMAQPHLVRVPLVDGEGNFGSEEENAAASRYTNAKLSPLGEALVANLDKRIIPYTPSYDGETEEPVYFNAPFPMVLASNTLGIGFGMATSIPSFPISEIINSTIETLEKGELQVEKLVELLKPDFPSGCFVVNAESLPTLYSTGRGSLLLRSSFEIKENILVINNLPIYSIASEIEKEILQAKEKGELGDIIKIINTTAEKQQLTLQLKKGTNTQQLIQDLCQFTNVERNFTFNLQMLDEKGKPFSTNLPKFFLKWVELYKKRVEKELQLDLEALEIKLEISKGLKKAILSIDSIITLIKNSENRLQAMEKLQSEGFSAIQSEAILNIKLVRLTRLQAVELQKEIDELREKIDKLLTLLSTPSAFLSFLRGKLESCKKFDIPRTSKIEQSKFIKIAKSKQEVFYAQIDKSKISILDSMPKGKVIAISKKNPLHILQESSTIPIIDNSIPIYSNYWAVVEDNAIIFHFSSDGRVKATESKEFKTTRKAKAVGQEKVVFVGQTVKNQKIKFLLTTQSKKQLQFESDEIPLSKRGAKGVIAAKLGNEKIEKVEIIPAFIPSVPIGRNKIPK